RAGPQPPGGHPAPPDGEARTGGGGGAAGCRGTRRPPPLVSVAGNALFAVGATSHPLAVPAVGGPTFGLTGFNDSLPSQAVRAAMDTLRTLDLDNLLVQSVAGNAVAAFTASGVLAPVLAGTGSTVDALFAGQSSSLARQLNQVARIIEARGVLGATQQIF